MIRYRLACPKGHEFEGWFPSSDGYELQVSKKLVACPDCGSTKVKKALMAPSVVTSEKKIEARKRRRARPEPQPSTAAPPAPVPASLPTTPDQVLTGPQREMLRQLKTLRDKVLANAEYVGPRFADEARKMHNEETPVRGIYGEATREDVEELAADGIEVLPVPVLPDDHN